MSEDSFAARRAMRVAGAASESDEEQDVNVGDSHGAGLVQRPGQETEDPTAQAKPGASSRQPRPKLTYELLTAPAGIPFVFANFREAFHKQRSGRKNVTRDLGLLLELYEQWQKQVFPHDDFDTFAKKVANLYGRPGGKMTKSATLKADMRQLRESVIDLALEGMGDELDGDAPMEQNAPNPGASTQIENEQRNAVSDCHMLDFDTAAEDVVPEHHDAVDHLAGQYQKTSGANSLSANEDLADAELDALMMAHNGHQEFWEEDALEEMMVPA